MRLHQKTTQYSKLKALDLKRIDLKIIREKIQLFLDSGTLGAKATSVLLGLVAMAGAMSVALAAPNLFGCLGAEVSQRKYKRRYQKQCYSTISYAKRRGYLKQVKQKGQIHYVITNKGRRILYFEVLKNLEIKKPEKWDGRWRIVIFDIPNKHNQARDFLRGKLKQLKFKQLQKSVFICPWPCLKEINLLRRAFRVQKYVSLITAESLEDQNYWRQIFSLDRKS